MNAVLLDLLSLAAIASTILVITAKNPVMSVLYLIAVFLNVAGYLVLLGIAYLGLVYLIVYVGAIAILFLFVIMMLNLRLVELVETGQQYTKNLPMAAMLAGTLFYELLTMVPAAAASMPKLLFSWFNAVLFNAKTAVAEANIYQSFSTAVHDGQLASFTQIESIGHSLYTYAALWLVVASVIFMLAMVGPIVLCMTPADTSTAEVK